VPTFRLTIEYDGTDFSGWQIQPQVRTVQGVLEEGLATMLRTPVRIQGAGRTDAGVHARGQVASFEAETDLSPERIQKGLSALCRPDVSVVEAAVAPDGFNARFDAQGKHYRYRVLCRRTPSPLERKTCYFVPQPLDGDAMKAAAERLVGAHDFRGFRASDCGREKTVCHLSEVSLKRDDRGLLTIDVRGNFFLKYMVRIIAGTLIDIGRGRKQPEVIQAIFDTGDRTLAGITAPPGGLTMMQVYYPEGWIRS
jgi:tRNA pseudouridine38-40 synthase